MKTLFRVRFSDLHQKKDKRIGLAVRVWFGKAEFRKKVWLGRQKFRKNKGLVWQAEVRKRKGLVWQAKF